MPVNPASAPTCRRFCIRRHPKNSCANSQALTLGQDTPTAVTLTGSDPNSPPRALTFVVTANPAHGTLSGTAPNLTYTPNGGYVGPDGIQFRANNGALDNASGTAALLQLAKAFVAMRQRPKRSVLFLAVTAEEQGLLGSQYYAATPLYPLARTLANINIDGINVGGRTRDLTVIGLGASELDDYARAAAQEQGRTLRPDPEPEKGYYYRSDHFNFAKQGVPAFYVESGIVYIGKSADWVYPTTQRAPAIR